MSHPVSMFCQGKVCGPCHSAGVNALATHKIGEEFLDDVPGVIRHGLTQYVCCRCFGLMMGPLAQHQCGTTFPASPRMVPVYSILGEKLVASGIVDTKPLDDPEHSLEPGTDYVQLLAEQVAANFLRPQSLDLPPWMTDIRRPDTLPLRRPSRSERDLQESMTKLSKHMGWPVSANVVDASQTEEGGDADDVKHE